MRPARSVRGHARRQDDLGAEPLAVRRLVAAYTRNSLSDRLYDQARDRWTQLADDEARLPPGASLPVISWGAASTWGPLH